MASRSSGKCLEKLQDDPTTGPHALQDRSPRQLRMGSNALPPSPNHENQYFCRSNASWRLQTTGLVNPTPPGASRPFVLSSHRLLISPIQETRTADGGFWKGATGPAPPVASGPAPSVEGMQRHRQKCLTRLYNAATGPAPPVASGTSSL